MTDNITELGLTDFPPLLRETPACPKKLFYRGSLPDWNAYTFLAVVGSRKYSNYGKEVCEHLIAGLSGYPIVIVSGLALGIDAVAHKAALSHKLKTIAVPGSGLNPRVLYPASHQQLAEKIIEADGALISEFEPDFKATPWSFPQRNRIMAGMSHAILVIEAEIKSGTLITSKLATDYNRDVLTVPGSIFSSSSEGPHMLLRLGATPITSSSELLDALGFTTEIKSKTDYSDCSPDELTVLKSLGNPLAREELARETNIPIVKLNTLLSLLEIKGYIKESGGEIHRV